MFTQDPDDDDREFDPVPDPAYTPSARKLALVFLAALAVLGVNIAISDRTAPPVASASEAISPEVS